MTTKFIIGRNPSASLGGIPIKIDDSSEKTKLIGRTHCAIYIENGQMFIEDLNSTNGTYVNNQKIQSKTAININSRITLSKSYVFPINHPSILAALQNSSSHRKPEKNYSPDIGSIKYATWGQRLGGFILDMLFIWLLSVPLGLLVLFLDELAIETQEMSMLIISLIIYMMGSFLIIHFYYAYQLNKDGQTLGKRIAKVKCLDGETLETPSMMQGWGRYLGYILSTIIFLMGFFMPLWTKKSQALHDMMANTIVVREN